MSDCTRFRFSRPKCDDVVGVVRGGAGGFLREARDLRRLHLAQQYAADGYETGLYEPETGAVAVYPHFSAAGDGPMVVVHLVGASIEVSS